MRTGKHPILAPLWIIAERSWPYALLIAGFWVVRYWHSAEFGLYEDDLTHLPIAAQMSLSEVFAFAFDPERIANLYGQGHPLHYTFMYLLTNLGWRVSDVQGAYWLGFAVEAVNIALFYALLRRMHSHALGILGGLAFILFSADTTQVLLTYSLGVHPSLTLLLLASHAYLSNRRWLAYILAGLTLLTYEVFFTVFLAVPLLRRHPSPPTRGELVKHAAILALMLIAVAGWRTVVADDRLGGLTPYEMLAVPLIHMAQGTVVSLGTYLYRPLQVLLALSVEVGIAIALGSGVALALISSLDFGAPAELQSTIELVTSKLRQSKIRPSALAEAWNGLPERVLSLLQIGLAGVLMLMLAYPLTFTVRAYAISGRDTRVHAAGVMGGAILLGSLLLLSLWLAESYGRKSVVTIGIAVWVGLLVGYGFVVQRDYRLAWRYQQEFWSELVWLIPDVDDGTVILVDPEGLKDPRQIGANYWNLPRVLDQLYSFPPEWDRPPRVYRLAEEWESGILGQDGKLNLTAETTFAPPSTLGTADSERTILIDTSRGSLERLDEILDLDGREVKLRPAHSIGEPPFPKGYLYRYLIDEPSAIQD